MTRLASLLGCLLLACGSGEPGAGFEQARARGSSPEREWRAYLHDRAVTHASPLRAIHVGNVGELEVAWRYDSRDARPGSQIQFNPLVVKGVLYGCSPALRLFALDASTGEELWSFSPGVDAETWSSSRGAVYWQDGDDERLLFGAGSFLHAVDARTGRSIPSFGDGGRVDLREGLGRDLDGDFMGVVATTPGTLFEDLLLMGSRVGEGHGAAPGHVRAFDVRTGEQRWIFHTIPQPGETGYETWPPDAWQRSGGANAWAGISVDVDTGTAFVPTGSAAFDFYGADREGDNLFANSLIALDARTGKRRWHFQAVRHDIWDRDLPAPPNLVEVVRDGESVPAVAQVTKTGDTFLFRRDTGEPLFPIRENPVAGPGVPGEFVPASQPAPTRPPPFVRQHLSLDLLTDRSPALRAEVQSRVERMRFGDTWVPASVEGSVQYPGIDGGAEWGGAAWDAETGLLYVNANQVPWVLQMVEAPADFDPLSSLAGGYLLGCGGCHGSDMKGDGVAVPSLLDVDERLSPFEIYRIVRDGRGRMPGMAGTVAWWQNALLSWFVYTADAEDAPSNWARQGDGPTVYIHAGYQKLLDAEQLPGSKPPWGNLTAIDLSAGEIAWQLPLGDYPQVLEAGGSGLGAENYGGPIVTGGGLVFIAATPDGRFRAFDKRSGALLWQVELPAAGFATPATYEADGRQFVVIAAGGGKLGVPSGSEYVAFALPRE